MTLKLDSTRVSVVIVCTACPHWRAFAFTKREAWESAARHEANCHPADDQARDGLANHLAKARHAV